MKYMALYKSLFSVPEHSFLSKHTPWDLHFVLLFLIICVHSQGN